MSETVELQDAEWVTLPDGTRVVRYVESGEWIIVTKDGVDRDPFVQSVENLERELKEAEEELAERPGMDNNDALQILCRVFDDFEPIWDEWLEWYNPKDWFHRSRGFGVFLRLTIDKRNSAASPPISNEDISLAGASTEKGEREA